MSSPNPNASSPGSGEGIPSSDSPHSNLARLLVPVEAELSEARHVTTLQLAPMRAAVALAVLSEQTTSAAAEVLVSVPESDAAATAGLGGVPRRLDRRLAAERERGHVVVDGEAWWRLSEARVPQTIEAVLVEGPIEAGDVRAIAHARAAGDSALDVELRASIAIRIEDARLLTVQARDRDDVVPFVAECFRRYVAALRGSAPADVARPERSLVHRILDRSGSMRIRPIETQVYSTAIDVGVMTRRGETGPADTSLVFDLFGNSWHGD